LHEHTETKKDTQVKALMACLQEHT
jgi:hypothetical protein